MDEEEKKRILASRNTMVGATQAPLTLGGGLGIPSFPTTFSNINPQPATSPIRFGAGGTAEMGAGGANVRYPSNLGIAGGQYGPLEMGARDFSPARLPQAQSPSMFGTVPFTPFTPRAERMAPALSTGLTPLPERATTIAGGPASMNIAGPMTAEAQGRQAIQTPYGNIYATQQQAANMMTPRTAAQQGSRTPEQQQALIAQMRERGSAIGQNIAQKEAERQQKLTQDYYAFRQRGAESTAQEALSTAGGRSPDVMRGAQALIEAERMRQAQQGRSPMSNEPINAFGLSFQRGAMGEYSPVRDLTSRSGLASSGSPQPLGGRSSFGGSPSFGNGGFPSFDEWMGQRQPSTAEIIFGQKAPSKGDAYTDFQLEESRRALREKRKQEEIARNERRAFENPAAKGFYQF